MMENKDVVDATSDEFKPTASQPVNYQAILKGVEDLYPMVQVLDKEGKVVNEDLVPDLSDEQLVDLMEKMVFTRCLYEETMSFSKQGRLGFYAPTLGQEASKIASAMVIDKDDWLYGAYRDIPQLISHRATIAQGFNWSLRSLSEPRSFKPAGML